ncbi:hypothetical protein D037_3796A, partial [Vibrio parahaemolyticus IDH02640]
MHRSHLEHQPA